MTVRLEIGTADQMAELGARLAPLLRPGDLVLLDGPLGAGKTTLVRGLGAALGVRGEVTSPTFVIARRHPPLAGGPPLLHIDAYRATAAELADQELDLESAECVTIVEWGGGKADEWSPDRLHITIEAGGADGKRTVTIAPVGQRWRGTDLARVVRP